MKAIALWDGINPTEKPFWNGEHVSQLMHGVGYGEPYKTMMDFQDDPNLPPSSNDRAMLYWHALNHNFCITGGNGFEMEITWTAQSQTLTVNLNGKRYEEAGFDNFGDDHLYLQSHWGSGVVFTSANFSPDE